VCGAGVRDLIHVISQTPTQGVYDTCLFIPTCGYFRYNHLVLRRCILTDKFSPVRRARSSLSRAIPEVLTKSHIVVFIKLSISHRLHLVIIALPVHPPLVGFSSEGLMIGDNSVHLREGYGLVRYRRMPFVQCPEQMLTLPM